MLLVGCLLGVLAVVSSQLVVVSCCYRSLCHAAGFGGWLRPLPWVGAVRDSRWLWCGFGVCVWGCVVCVVASSAGVRWLVVVSLCYWSHWAVEARLGVG